MPLNLNATHAFSSSQPGSYRRVRASGAGSQHAGIHDIVFAVQWLKGPGARRTVEAL
jgi:hypothetical protein